MRINTPLNTIETDINLAHYDMGPSSTSFTISTQGINISTWVCPSDFILLLNDVAGRRVLLLEEQEQEIVELCKIVVNECSHVWERERACNTCNLDFPKACERCKYSEVKDVQTS